MEQGFGEFLEALFSKKSEKRYSAFTNCPFSPHFSHFCGLQRPSLLNPQEHFQVAMVSPPRLSGCLQNIPGNATFRSLFYPAVQGLRS
jgi:hypothetical protein